MVIVFFLNSNYPTLAANADEATTKKLRSAAARHTDANKRRLTDSDGERPLSLARDEKTANEYRSPEDMYRLYFVDNHWYLFFRYHHILCERLHKIYRHSIQVAEQSSEDSKSREQSVAEALKLRNKCKSCSLLIGIFSRGVANVLSLANIERNKILSVYTVFFNLLFDNENDVNNYNPPSFNNFHLIFITTTLF